MIVNIKNAIVIEGSKEDIENFIKENRDYENNLEISFAKSIPVPEYVSSDTWLKWNLSNWGTPIEPIDFENWETDYSEPNPTASIIFTTHWSSPTVYIFTVSEKYPELTFSLTQYKADITFDYITVRNGKPVDDYKEEYYEEIWDIRSSQERWEQDTSLDYLDPAYMGKDMEEYKMFLDYSNDN